MEIDDDVLCCEPLSEANEVKNVSAKRAPPDPSHDFSGGKRLKSETITIVD